ncbi:MAG: hypothetical protein IBX43_10645 [Campylobacterales bacterium]|nr:hypothetical protein [Campylobacterales bacterium]
MEFLEEDAPVWNSGSVYFDDEVVRYQGKLYLALKKTSADMPGRCKSGIWKLLGYEDSQKEADNEEFCYSEEPPVEPKNKESGKSEVPEPTPAKVATKPLAKKQTLKERQDEGATKSSKAEEQKAEPVAEQKMNTPATDQHSVNEALKEIEFKKIKGFNADEQNIVSKLILPQHAKEDVQLTWTSSNPELISALGQVKRPDDCLDVAVNLSVTASKNKMSATRYFTLWVKALEKRYSDKECVDRVHDILDFEQIKGGNTKTSAITQDLVLPTQGLFDTQILWAVKEQELLELSGRLKRDRVKKDTPVRLYAIIVKNDTQRLKYFDLTLLGQ